MLGRKLVRKIIDQIFGLAEHRELPRFGVFTPPNYSWLARSRTLADHDNIESVILLRDTFTHFFEPEIEQAALKVLDACGVHVNVLPFYGAGRTLISKGFIEPARRHAGRILDALQEQDPAGRLPVLGIEPSELYTLCDEFFDLLPNRRAEIDSLAKRALLVEEFLVRPRNYDKKHELRITKILPEFFPSNKTTIFLHGHCYQKARPPAEDGFPVGQHASAELLRLAGYEVELIPSGCCGMAGAFGYEAEHYDVSMQVGELALFPALRNALEGQERELSVQVAAVGTSCRAQVLDGTGILAKHPLLLIQDRMS